MVELPEGWGEESLGAVADHVRRRVRVVDGDTYDLLGVRWYAEGPFLKARRSGADIKASFLYEVRGGDFIYNRLFGWKGSFGLVEQDLEGCHVSGEFPTFVLDPERVSAEFLWRYFSLPRVWRAIENQSSGSTRTSRLRFKEEDFLRMRIPLPPLSEQRAIARVLRVVQGAKEATEQVAAAARDLKKSMMHRLFAYGPATGAPNDDGRIETEFGEVPAHWEIQALSECGVIQSGVAKGRRLGSSETVEVPYLRVANVQDGFLDLQEIKTMSLRADELSRYALRSGDVLLTEGGDFDKLGRGYIWRGQIDPCVHQNHIFAVRPDPTKASPEYLSYLVQSPYARRYFLKVAHRTTNLASINKTKLGDFPVLLAPPEEQALVVAA